MSHHQGDIDWSKLPQDKIRFVYAKASEGGDWRDRLFMANITAAAAAGFKEIGAYHFFTLCKSGEEQARNFLSATFGINLTLPPAVDLEYVGNCRARPDKADFLRELKKYVSDVEASSGLKSVIYTTKEFHEDYLAGTEFETYPLWLRDIFFRPSRENYPSLAIWQYADNVRMAGIAGPVDINARIGGD